MCLFPESNELTAKEDIIVYKFIAYDNTSLNQYFQYEPNTLYRLRKKLKIEFDAFFKESMINSGFHSYNNKIKDRLQKMVNKEELEMKLVEFTIPKGAKYYIGMLNDIVSSSIRSGDLSPI